MLFQRVKPLDVILATAEKKSLKRQLGAFQLTMLGIGAIIGTGIFVLTSEAAQYAGPGMMLSFIIAGFVCGVAALCYAELASMVPVSGSAYTYSYAVLGEFIAWVVGWARILEYAVAASAVSVGWSGYLVGMLDNVFHITLPKQFTGGWFDGGIINLPAVFIALLVTALLVRGTKESATVNAALVAIKVLALSLFIALTIPVLKADNFNPFAPMGSTGVITAAATIFFAYVGFDAVSTAAEETNNPQRNIPIGLIGSLVICTIFYLLVAAGAIGAYGAQPVFGPNGEVLTAGSRELAERCHQIAASGPEPLVCSKEALAHVLRSIGHSWVGNALGLAAFLALPSVILMMIYGQTRIFFTMSRDGLLPDKLSTVHPKWQTPHIMTMITGAVVTVAAAFLPVGKLAAISNSGTLFAFFAVSLSVLLLRKRDPNRHRPFRTPLVWVIAPLSILGCIILFMFLPMDAKMLFPIWTALGLVIYYLYSRRRSHMAPGNEHLLAKVKSEPQIIDQEPDFYEGPRT